MTQSFLVPYLGFGRLRVLGTCWISCFFINNLAREAYEPRAPSSIRLSLLFN